jgi:N4-gp56 family major capsid protein
VAFVHPRQAKFLRKSDDWINVNHYASPENILAGEIGQIEGIRFVETTMVPYVKQNTQQIWADGVNTGKTTTVAANTVTDVYRAVVVGDYAVGLAETLPVELRDNGVEDFGRTRKLAYYGIWGAGVIEPGHAVVLETA